MSSRVDRTPPPLPSIAGDSLDGSGEVAVQPPETRSLVQGMLGVVQRLSASLLARHRQDGFEPQGTASRRPTAFETMPPTRASDPWSANPQVRYAVPTTRELLSELPSVRRAPITSTERETVLHLTVSQRRQFSALLRALEVLKAGRLSSAGYFLSGLQSAAEVAGDDRTLFVDLAHLSFANPTGEGPETTFRSLVGGYPLAADGFNPNIVNAQGPHGAMTHPFAQRLSEGFKRPSHVSDSAGQDPGDLRSGLFATMLGRALAEGKLSPRDVVQWVQWAMLAPADADEATLPPWGNAVDDARGLNERDYDFTRWNATFKGHAH